MIVITLTNCPPSLRGDLTKWLQEISTGVYAGQVPARVRDALWERVCENSRDGRAVMVYNTNNEQRMGFRTHQCEWEPIDFDGLKLMMHPGNPNAVQRKEKEGQSIASRMHMARTMTSARQYNNKYPRSYCVVDVETTGLDKNRDEIIELGALRVRDGDAKETFSACITISRELPQTICALTGITEELLQAEGIPLRDGLEQLLQFIGDDRILCYNAAFDHGFLQRKCEQEGIPPMQNKCMDAYVLARRQIEEIEDWKLETVARHLGIPEQQTHRSIADCQITYQVYEKVIEKLLNEE